MLNFSAQYSYVRLARETLKDYIKRGNHTDCGEYHQCTPFILAVSNKLNKSYYKTIFLYPNVVYNKI